MHQGSLNEAQFKFKMEIEKNFGPANLFEKAHSETLQKNQYILQVREKEGKDTRLTNIRDRRAGGLGGGGGHVSPNILKIIEN